MSSDYERLVADMHEMNEHGLRDNFLDYNEAAACTLTLMQHADAMTQRKGIVWKVLMSEPHDRTQRFWIILEGRVFDNDAG